MNTIKFAKEIIDNLFELNPEKDNITLFNTGHEIYAIHVQVIKIKKDLYISFWDNKIAKLLHQYQLILSNNEYVLIKNNNYDTSVTKLVEVDDFIRKCKSDYFLHNSLKNIEFKPLIHHVFLKSNKIESFTVQNTL